MWANQSIEHKQFYPMTAPFAIHVFIYLFIYLFIHSYETLWETFIFKNSGNKGNWET